MDSDKYFEVAVINIEEVLQNKELRLSIKWRAPICSGYKPMYDYTTELEDDGIQWYQEIIGQIWWALQFVRVDILLEVSLLSQHMVLPSKGHIEQALHIIGHLKEHKKLIIIFDCGNPEMDKRLFK